jgi:hypothetical protein
MLKVRFGSKDDMCAAKERVCFAPESGHVQKILYQKILLSAFSMCCPALSLPAQQQIRAEQNHGPYTSK